MVDVMSAKNPGVDYFTKNTDGWLATMNKFISVSTFSKHPVTVPITNKYTVPPFGLA